MAISLARHSIYSLLANLSVAVSNWLLLVIIAKQFDSTQLGQFVLALSVCAPAFLFASFKMRTLLVVDTEWRFTLEEYAFARFLSNALVTTAILATTLFGLLNLSVMTLMLVLVYKWCDAWSEFCQSYLRRLHEFERGAVSLGLRSVCTMLAMCLAALFTKSFEFMLILWTLVALLFAVYDSWLMWVLSKNKDFNAFDWSNLLQLRRIPRALQFYKQHLTLAAALIISSLFVNLPNILLSYQLNLEAAGTFATISYFLVAGGILINSLSQVATPKLSLLYRAANYTDFVLLVKKLCLVGLIIGIAGLCIAWLFGGFFLQTFYNQHIAQHGEVLNWIMTAAAIRYVYIFLGTALGAIQQFHVQTKIYTAGIMCLLMSAYILIELNGLAGAAQAMVLATLVELLLFVVVSRQVLKSTFCKTQVTV